MKKLTGFILLMSMAAAAFSQRANVHSFASSSALPDSVVAARKMQSLAAELSVRDTAQCFRLLNSAASVFKKYKMYSEEGDCYKSLGDIFFEAGNFNRSFANFTKAEDVFYEVDQHKWAQATLGTAKSQYQRSYYRFAIRNFSEAAEYGLKHDDKSLIAEASEYLGLINSIYQYSDKSKYYFSKALATRMKLKDDKGCLRISELLFEIYYKEKKYDSSLHFCKFNESHAASINNYSSHILAKINKVFALVRLQRLDEAKEQINEIEGLSIPNSDVNSRLRFEIAKGNYFFALNNKSDGLGAYKKAIELTNNANTPDQLAQVYGHIADSYSEIGDFKNAYTYGLKYYAMMNNFYESSIGHLSKIDRLTKEDVAASEIKYLSSLNRLKESEILRSAEWRRNLQQEARLKDSILTQEKQLSTLLESRNNAQQKQLTIQTQLGTVLKKESDRQKQQLQEERLVKSVLIAGLFVLIGLGSFATYQYRKTKSKNHIIQNQAAELETLMKEIHHRIKNNLQIVSSLLDIQASSLFDHTAIAAIKESRNRVQSMAILHQHLYQEGNVRGVIMDTYLKGLSESLFQTYNIDTTKIQLEIDISSVNIDIDTAIPIGLIVSELVSNSLKYAFRENGSGRIQIKLTHNNGGLELFVKDDGIGFPEKADIQKQTSIGIQLVNAFVKKLRASAHFYNHGGANVSISIPKFKAVSAN